MKKSTYQLQWWETGKIHRIHSSNLHPKRKRKKKSVVTIGIVQHTSSCQLWTTLSPLDLFSVHCMNYYIVVWNIKRGLFETYFHFLLSLTDCCKDEFSQRRMHIKEKGPR